MQRSELIVLLRNLKEAGYVPSLRSGPTGIGHTLESYLGLSENNLPIPDIGGRVEVKATRTNWGNLISLFTFNKAAWERPQKELIERWGLPDGSGRINLYSTVSATEPNTFGFQLSISDNYLVLSHAPTNTELARWDIYNIVGKFTTKFARLLLVHADSVQIDGKEHFRYDKAELLSDPGARTFRDGFVSGVIKVDIRMHLKPNGVVRNHGTGFRIMEQDLPHLFDRVDQLMP